MIFAVTAENFTRKNGNAKANIRAAIGITVMLSIEIYETC